MPLWAQHLMGGQFNASSVELPFGFFPELEDHRYEGWYAGGGVTAGYQWVMSKHWNFEASIGLGYDYIKQIQVRNLRREARVVAHQLFRPDKGRAESYLHLLIL